MPRFTVDVMKKSVIITQSQEEALEAIVGWDDARQAAPLIDDTPSQPAYTENSSPSSLARVFDVTGSSLCSGKDTSDAATMRERGGEGVLDSYSEAFESDRAESPFRDLSWGLKDPKSPTVSVAIVTGEAKTPMSVMRTMNESEASNRPNNSVLPEAAGVTIGLATEDPLYRGATMAEKEDTEEKSGRKEGDGDVDSRQPMSAIGVRAASPQLGSALPEDVLTAEPSSKPSGEGGGSGSASAFMRQGKDSQPEISGEHTHRTAFGFQELDISVVRNTVNCAVLDTLDQITNSVQANLQVLDNIVLEDDPSEKDSRISGDHYDRRRGTAEHDVHSPGKVGERAAGAERQELESSEWRTKVSGKENLKEKEKSKEPLLSPTSSRILRSASKTRAADNPGGTTAAATPKAGRVHCPPFPPKGVQEKLDKLRSQSGKKRDCSESGFNLLSERVKKERDMVSSNSVLEAIKLRSGERRAAEVTATDLLKTALAIGVSLPRPFHRNYFCE